MMVFLGKLPNTQPFDFTNVHIEGESKRDGRAGKKTPDVLSKPPKTMRIINSILRKVNPFTGKIKPRIEKVDRVMVELSFPRMLGMPQWWKK